MMSVWWMLCSFLGLFAACESISHHSFGKRESNDIAWSDEVCGGSGWQASFALKNSEIRARRQPARILLFLPSAGLGNRLFGRASALAVAMSTGRALMIDDPVLSELYDSAKIDVSVDEALLQTAMESGGALELPIYSKEAHAKLREISEKGMDYPEAVLILKTNTIMWPALRSQWAFFSLLDEWINKIFFLKARNTPNYGTPWDCVTKIHTLDARCSF